MQQTVLTEAINSLLVGATAMPLQGFKVVEVGTSPSAAYCGRLLADFGADVFKVEPPGGDPGRLMPPLIDLGERQESGYFAFLNFNKKSVIPEKGELQRLISAADVLIDSLGETERKECGIDHEALRRDRPDLVIADVSWFGKNGPYRDYRATDSVCRALAGLIKLIGPEEGPPLALPDYQACILGGLSTFIPIMAGLLERLEGAPGRSFEVSVHEANVALAELQVSMTLEPELPPERRCGINKFPPVFPMGIYPCKSGWLGVTVVTPAQWKSFCHMLGLSELADHPDYSIGPDRMPRAAELEALFVPRLLERTAGEWFAESLERQLPCAIVPNMADMLEMEVFRRRDAIVPICIGDRTIEAPGSPLHLTATPPRFGGAVAAPGEHNAEIPGEAGGGEYAPVRDGGRKRPLEGLRIIDLSMGWAGPFATRNLADLGADVIKVEACRYPDWWRGVDKRPIVVEEVLYEKSRRFNMMNRNKRAITLDLTLPEGVRLVKELVKDADALIENYSAGVLPKFGLNYERLRLVNPSLVMLSMPAFGTRSAWKDGRAYGSTLEHGSGLPTVSGVEGGPPVTNHVAFGDAVGGLNAASALLTALLHRKKTGVGQFIDLSQVQCMLPFTAAWAIEQSATGKVGPRMGNRHPLFTPHGIFRCAGEDQWILIAVTDDTSWLALCSAIGREDLAGDERLKTAAERRDREEEIEKALELWTCRRSADTAMEQLQERGVACGAVRSPGELLQDPHLLERKFWQMVDRAYTGPQPLPSAAYRENGASYPALWPAATLGQFNEEVLSGVLGLSAQELAALAERSVIGTELIQ